MENPRPLARKVRQTAIRALMTGDGRPVTGAESGRVTIGRSLLLRTTALDDEGSDLSIGALAPGVRGGT